MIILDEATGALDPRSETVVLQGYAALLEGRTTFVITHRHSLARQADRVVVIRGGRIVDDGPPDELETGAGAFRELFDQQVPR